MKHMIRNMMVIPILVMTIVTCSTLSQISDDTIRPATIEEVILLDGPFKDAQDREAASLLENYDLDRFLARPRIAAGLEPKGEVYGGWEEGLTGHTLGHYISGCARAWVITYNPEYKRRADYMVSELAEIQVAYGNGFVAGPPDTKNQFENHIAEGDITSAGFDLNGIWVPIYGIHKIFAGLYDAYHFTGNQQALDVAHGFGLWFYDHLMHLSEDDFIKIRACEHGGIQESFAELYVDTGDDRMLDLANRFYDPKLMDPLYAGEDNLMGLHANTQFPKYIGMARLYEITGSERERAITEFFWDRVVNHHSYVTGGNSLGEHFGPADHMNNRIAGNTTETCNTYNMIKLSSHNFMWNRSSDVADFMERAMLNHSLSALNPENAHITYFLHLGQGVRRDFRNPHQFSCCEGSAMEHHFLYPETIYYVGKNQVYLNQFIASRFYWEEKGVVLLQNTGFPHAETSSIRVYCKKPSKFNLLIRNPHWAEKGMEVLVNGTKIDASPSADGYIAIDRRWNDGDIITISFPFTLRLEAMPDNPDRVAIFHGPLALGGDLGSVDDSAASDADYVPVLLTSGMSPDDWIRPVNGVKNTFETFGAGEPRDVILRPFYQLYDCRYSLYWDMFTNEEWESEKSAYRASIADRQALEDLTVDFLQPGEMQPERDHNFQGENTSVSEGRWKTRQADDGGWFSFDMNVLSEEPVTLVASYMGGLTVNDSGSFDIEVDGTVLASKVLDWHGQNRVQDVYAIPEELTSGKDRITITFRANHGSRTASLGGLRIIRNR